MARTPDIARAEKVFARQISKMILSNKVLRYTLLGLESMNGGSIRAVFDEVEREIRDTKRNKLEVPASFSAKLSRGRHRLNE